MGKKKKRVTKFLTVTSVLTELTQVFQTFRVGKHSHRSHQWSTNVSGDSVTVWAHVPLGYWLKSVLSISSINVSLGQQRNLMLRL